MMRTRNALKTLLLSMLLVLAVGMQAQTKIVVLTDTHVMAPELLIKDGSAWQQYLAGDRKLVDYSQQLFDTMIDRLKTDIRPDIVCITGDLSKDGELVSHQYVAAKLEQLREAGIRVLVIPGNHDYGTTTAHYYDGDNTRPAETASMEQLATIYEHFGYDSSSEREATTLTYACEPVEGLTVIGIDTGIYGQLSSTTLQWVCDKASAAFAAGNRVIALMHHALIPHITGIEKIGSLMAVVQDYEQVRNRLANAGVSAVFTGHLHFGDIAQDFNEDLSVSIYDVSTAALASYPCSYRELTLSKDLQELQVSTGYVTSLPSQADFTSVARNRLRGNVESLIRSYTGDGNFITKGLINKAVELAADVVQLYADGNEHLSSDAADRLSTFNSMVSLASAFVDVEGKLSQLNLTMDDVNTMARSALENKTSCGIEGRESVTDDLSLTIPLRSQPREETAIRERPVSDDAAVWYTLQGVPVEQPTHGLYIRNGKLVIVR